MQQGLGEPFTGSVPVRNQPDATVRLYERDDEFGLSFGAIRTHCAYYVRDAVLAQPPDSSEPLDDNQVIERRFQPVGRL